MRGIPPPRVGLCPRPLICSEVLPAPIRMYDSETTLPTLRAGRTVLEGRSLHSTTVYQSISRKPGAVVAPSPNLTGTGKAYRTRKVS